jgi:hypothetical protein
MRIQRDSKHLIKLLANFQPSILEEIWKMMMMIPIQQLRRICWRLSYKMQRELRAMRMVIIKQAPKRDGGLLRKIRSLKN